MTPAEIDAAARARRTQSEQCCNGRGSVRAWVFYASGAAQQIIVCPRCGNQAAQRAREG